MCRVEPAERGADSRPPHVRPSLYREVKRIDAVPHRGHRRDLRRAVRDSRRADTANPKRDLRRGHAPRGYAQHGLPGDGWPVRQPGWSGDHGGCAPLAVCDGRDRGRGREDDGRDRSPAWAPARPYGFGRSEEHTSELQSLAYLVCRLLLEKKKKQSTYDHSSCSMTTE